MDLVSWNSYDPGFECKRPSFGGFKPLRINRFQGIKLATLKLDGWTDCIPKMRRKNDIPIFCGKKTSTFIAAWPFGKKDQI